MSQKPADTIENVKKCICPACPVYNECTKSKDQLLFCAKQASDCDDLDKHKACICPQCPVFKENDLKGGYYCIWDIDENGNNIEAMMEGMKEGTSEGKKE